MSSPTEELDALEAMADDFAAKILAPQLPELDEQDRVGPGTVRALLSSGLWSLGLPESVGGQGAARSTTLRIIERLARVSPAVALLLVHVHAATHALLAVDEQEVAERCAAGHLTVVGFTAARSGRNVARLDLGLPADRILLIVRPAGSMLTRSIPSGAPAHRSGLAGLGTGFFDVPDVGTDDSTWVGGTHEALVDAATRWWHLGTSATSLGAAGAAVEHSAVYVSTRKQFGAPLIELPTVARAVEQGRATLSDLGGALYRRADDDDGRLDAALARRVTDGAVQLCLDAIQLFGGYGYLREYAVERLLRDAVSLRAAAANLR